MEQDRIHEIIDWIKGGENKKPTSVILSSDKYVHYTCKNCKRNVYIRQLSLTNEEIEYGIKCGKCSDLTEHRLSENETIEYKLIPRGVEVIS